MSKDTTVVLDLRKLQQLERKLPGSVNKLNRELAFELEADIKTHFSSSSPSAPGQPPGIDTGNLRNSIQVRPYMGAIWRVWVDAAYGKPLEYGTARMAARPFVRPAVMRVRKLIPARYRALIK